MDNNNTITTRPRTTGSLHGRVKTKPQFIDEARRTVAGLLIPAATGCFATCVNSDGRTIDIDNNDVLRGLSAAIITAAIGSKRCRTVASDCQRKINDFFKQYDKDIRHVKEHPLPLIMALVVFSVQAYLCYDMLSHQLSNLYSHEPHTHASDSGRALSEGYNPTESCSTRSPSLASAFRVNQAICTTVSEHMDLMAYLQSEPNQLSVLLYRWGITGERQFYNAAFPNGGLSDCDTNRLEEYYGNLKAQRQLYPHLTRVISHTIPRDLCRDAHKGIIRTFLGFPKMVWIFGAMALGCWLGEVTNNSR